MLSKKLLAIVFPLLIIMTACGYKHDGANATIAAQSTQIAQLSSAVPSHPTAATIAPISSENVHQVVELARWGKGFITYIAWSLDGKEFMIASSSGVYRLDPNTMQQREFIDTNLDIRRLAISPDNKTLAFGSKDGRVSLWDVESGQEIRNLSESPGEEIRRHGTVRTLTFSLDGTILASSFHDGTIILWDVISGQKIFSLIGSENYDIPVAFSPNGTTVALGTQEGPIRLWNVPFNQTAGDLYGHTYVVRSLAFSPDGTMLASGSGDATVKVWDINNGNELVTLGGFIGQVFEVAFSSDGGLLVACAGRGEIKTWDTQSWSELQTISISADERIYTMSPDGKKIITISDTVKFRDTLSGRELHSLRWFPSPIHFYNDAIFSPDGKYLATAEVDHIQHSWGETKNWKVRLWDYTTEREIRAIDTGFETPNIAFSTDSTTIATGTNDGTVQLWNVDNGQVIHTLTGHEDAISSIEFSPDGLLLASASRDTTIKFWDATTGQEIRTLTGHEDRVSNIAFSPDGLLLASASSRENTIKLWDVTTGQEIRTLTVHEDAAYNIAFSPDGLMLASAISDNTIKLWDVTTGQEIRTLTGHHFTIWSVCFSNDGALLVSTSYDSINFWDVDQGRKVYSLIGNTDRFFKTTSLSPDGSLLVTTSTDGTIRIWGIPQ